MAMNVIKSARKILELEIEALQQVIKSLDSGFEAAVKLIYSCKGRVIVTGVGKTGIIAQKISSTLASTATPSYWMHAVEARHGDLGRVMPEDVVLAMSNSGETEVVQLLHPLKKIGTRIIAITGRPDSTLARYSDIVLDIGRIREACPLGLAPSCTTTAMLALGDALALTLFEMRDMTSQDYAFFHPGGELGRKLIRVRDIMRTGTCNPLASRNASVRQAIDVMSVEGSPGAVSLVDEDGRLAGFFTDGDLRRLLRGSEPGEIMDTPICSVMSRNPLTIKADSLAAEAYRVLREKRIDNIPVIDSDGVPIGIFDVQDWLDMDKGEEF